MGLEAKNSKSTSTPTPTPRQLNQRQQTYLLAIFEFDQREESWARGMRSRPASEWRWLKYFPSQTHPSDLYTKLREARLVDEGTGSTFEALATRELIERRWEWETIEGAVLDEIDEKILFVKLTPKGRALARQITGENAIPTFPANTLREWHWAALVKAYRAGEAGLTGDGGTYGGISWKTWLRLLNYKFVGLCP